MNLALLSPWQQLLWLVCAVALVVPIISWGVIGVIRGYFGAKEAHVGKIAKAIANALSQINETTLKKFEEAIEKGKEKTEKNVKNDV